MRPFLRIVAVIHYGIAAWMLLGAVLSSSELHFIAFGVFAACGTTAGIWAELIHRLPAKQSAPRITTAEPAA
jgi:hypothetical protein